MAGARTPTAGARHDGESASAEGRARAPTAEAGATTFAMGLVGQPAPVRGAGCPTSVGSRSGPLLLAGRGATSPRYAAAWQRAPQVGLTATSAAAFVEEAEPWIGARARVDERAASNQ
jgi:hypothetical protein